MQELFSVLFASILRVLLAWRTDMSTYCCCCQCHNVDSSTKVPMIAKKLDGRNNPSVHLNELLQATIKARGHA